MLFIIERRHQGQPIVWAASNETSFIDTVAEEAIADPIDTKDDAVQYLLTNNNAVDILDGLEDALDWIANRAHGHNAQEARPLLAGLLLEDQGISWPRSDDFIELRNAILAGKATVTNGVLNVPIEEDEDND